MHPVCIRILNRTLVRGCSTFASKVTPLQKASLLERCILVDENDKRIGSASKLDCHKVHENGELLLHRAFSVFLFNTQGELLIHKRAPSKVTYPSYVTNSCCSHPIEDFPEETDERDAIGVKHAAKRRLNYELGIPTSEIDLHDFTYLTRILYKFTEGGIWGEHELDYILFLCKDVTLNPNMDEVSEVTYVKQHMLHKYLESQKDPISPWFKLIVDNMLPTWWNNLSDLSKVQEHKVIQRFL